MYLLDGKPLTIVGVLTPAIEIGNLSAIDIWTPLSLDAGAPRDRRSVRVVGRLIPGATLDSADAELQPIVAAQTREHAQTNAGWQAHVVDHVRARLRRHLGDPRPARRHRRVRPAHRLRKPGEPGARAAGRTPAGTGRSAGARRVALAGHSAGLPRELPAQHRRRARRTGAGRRRPADHQSHGHRCLRAHDGDDRRQRADLHGDAVAGDPAAVHAVAGAVCRAGPSSRTRCTARARVGGRTPRRRRSVLIGSQVALAFSLLVVSALVVQSMHVPGTRRSRVRGTASADLQVRSSRRPLPDARGPVGIRAQLWRRNWRVFRACPAPG